MNTKLKLLAFLACALGAATLAGNFGAEASPKQAAATPKAESAHAPKAESSPAAKAESSHTSVKSRVFGNQAGSGHNSAKAPDGHGAKKPQHVASTDSSAAPDGAPKGKQSKGGHGTGWGYSGPSGPIHWGDLDPSYRN